MVSSSFFFLFFFSDFFYKKNDDTSTPHPTLCNTNPSKTKSDPIGKPLVPIGMVPTYSRDPGVLMDTDGSNYLIFGTYVFPSKICNTTIINYIYNDFNPTSKHRFFDYFKLIKFQVNLITVALHVGFFEGNVCAVMRCDVPFPLSILCLCAQ